MPMKKYQIAVLDDYQDVALEIADWSVLRDRADIVVFQNHLADPNAVIERLLPFDVVCVMRERTPESAKAAGAILVSKDQLFERADILTIHLVLSSRTRGLVGAAELERMKPTAWLINASRGPIVEEQALISVLKNKQIAGAAIDVFD